MSNLLLIPDTHRQQEIVHLLFAYDQKLIANIKAQKGACGSHTLRSWYFPTNEFRLDAFYQALKNNIFIDYSQPKKRFPRCPVIAKEMIACAAKSLAKIKSPLDVIIEI